MINLRDPIALDVGDGTAVVAPEWRAFTQAAHTSH